MNFKKSKPLQIDFFLASNQKFLFWFQLVFPKETKRFFPAPVSNYLISQIKPEIRSRKFLPTQSYILVSYIQTKISLSSKPSLVPPAIRRFSPFLKSLNVFFCNETAFKS